MRINIVAEFTEMAGRDGRSELLIGQAQNSLSLAYRGLTEIPRELTSGLASVEVLDLSHNDISYPNIPYIPYT